MADRGHGHGHILRTYRMSDVTFRAGAALAITWIYLRTLLVVPPDVDMDSWRLFAWLGGPPVLLVWVGTVWTVVAYVRDR